MCIISVKIGDQLYREFDRNRTDYRCIVSENLDIPPIVSVQIEDGRGTQSSVEVFQAQCLPDCAVFEALGKTYRIRFAKEGEWVDISTDLYDAFSANPEKAEPEFPYTWDYSKTCVMKLFLADKGSPVRMNFEEALDAIRQLDAVTAGVPKIVYLVGWQFYGHDDRYPNWDMVNPFLKCSHLQEEKAEESLIWLMDEAWKYNTCVSLHLNSSDAYEKAPDWAMYVKNDLIRKIDGGLYKRALFKEEWIYRINHCNEWKSGFYKERVDKLCKMLRGRLEKAGTIHSDAFMCFESEGTSLIEDIGGRSAMVRYWHSKGIDLTSEFTYSFGEGAETDDEYVIQGAQKGFKETTLGLMPAAWHLIQPLEYYLKRPAAVLAGSNVEPQSAFLFGSSDGAEAHLTAEGVRGLAKNWEQEMKKGFCTTSAVALYLYTFERLALENDGQRAVYSEGLVADYSSKTIVKKDVVIRDHNDIFVPLVWEENTIMVYSENGYAERCWKFADEWISACTSVDIYENTKDGRRYLTTERIVDGTVTLGVKAGQMLIVKPHVVN